MRPETRNTEICTVYTELSQLMSQYILYKNASEDIFDSFGTMALEEIAMKLREALDTTEKEAANRGYFLTFFEDNLDAPD